MRRTAVIGRGVGSTGFVVLLIVLRALAAVGFITSLLRSGWLPAGLLAAAVAVLLAGSVVRWTFLLLMVETDALAPPPGLRVAMVTSFVPAAESLSMLERTLTAMQGVHYPHDTWLLDEGDDPAVKALCATLGVRHFSRSGRAEYQTEHGQFQRATKHGNYNAWLTDIGFADYDVLAAIDPDHVPAANFLTATLGQLADPRIAFVQSPQEYYNGMASLIARACCEESRDFYWISQRAFQRFGSPSVIGAHGIHRMTALRAMGGLAPHIADDVLLTLRYQLAGWQGVYVARVLARGLAPVDWSTYLKQQRRWAAALLDVKLRWYPRMVHGMAARGRLVGFLQGLSGLQDAVAALCVLTALCAGMIIGISDAVPALVKSPLVISSAVVLLLTGLYPHLYHGPHRNAAFYWRAGYARLVKWPYIILALFDVIARRDLGYALTAKGERPRARDWTLYWPHLLLCAIVGAAALLGVALGTTRSALPHLLAALALLPSILPIVGSVLGKPPAFDPLLAAGQFERSADEKRAQRASR